MQYLRPKGLVVFKQATISASLAAANQKLAKCFLTVQISNKATRKQIDLFRLSADPHMTVGQFYDLNLSKASAITTAPSSISPKNAYGYLWTNNRLYFDNTQFAQTVFKS
jgi:hypothetical protein